MTSVEIAAMKKITGIFDINRESDLSQQEITYDATPRVTDYGLFELVNFERYDKKPKTVAYYSMPLYEMNLKEYLSLYEGV